MLRKIATVAVTLVLVSIAQAAQTPTIDGRWHGSLLGHKAEVDVKQNGRQAEGAVRLYDPFGKKDMYHFKGTFDGTRVDGAHHSGHRFQGSLTPRGTIAGVLTTKGGHKVNVELFRR